MPLKFKQDAKQKLRDKKEEAGSRLARGTVATRTSTQLKTGGLSLLGNLRIGRFSPNFPFLKSRKCLPASSQCSAPHFKAGIILAFKVRETVDVRDAQYFRVHIFHADSCRS